jgi:hypothetical protein
MPDRVAHGCTFAEELISEITPAMRESEISEVVWQALILAYLDHDGWREAAEAVFVKHGYTPAEIVLWNSCEATEEADSEWDDVDARRGDREVTDA